MDFDAVCVGVLHAEPDALTPSVILTDVRHYGPTATDLVALVLAAREVAYEGATPEAIRALDVALERYAEVVDWDDAPTDTPL